MFGQSHPLIYNLSKQWQQGKMVDLWINLIRNSRDSNRKNRVNSNQSPGALHATNDRRARRALQEGHYHKAI